MHRLLSHSTVNPLRNRRFVAGKHRFRALRSQSSLQLYSFATTMLEAEERTSPRVSEKLRTKKVYTRDFLLSLMKLDTCRDVPSGADLSGLWKPKYSYGRDFLLSLTGLDVCKRLPRRFNYKVHGEIIVDADGSILGIPSAELSHDSKDAGRGSWYSRWGCGESGGCSDGKSDRNSQSEANNGSDDGKDCQVYYQLAKSNNPYRPPRTSKVEPTEVIEIYIYTKEDSISTGCQTKSSSEEDKTGGYSWKKETKTCEENQEQRRDKQEPVTVHDSENDKGQNEKSVDLVVKADTRHNTQTPSVHPPKPSRMPLEEVGVLSSVCINGTSEVCRRRERCVSKPTPATISQRDEISSHLMKKLTPPADNGAPKQLHVLNEVPKNQGVLACKQMEQSISSNSERSGSQHQSRSQPDARDLVHVEDNDKISECSSSLQKRVVSCKHETQSQSKHFLVKNGSNGPPSSTAGNSRKTWVVDNTIGNEAIPSVQGGLTITASEPALLEPGGYQLSAGDDKTSTSTADKCEPSGIGSGGSREVSFTQVTDSDRNEVVYLSIDDDWTEIVSMIQAEQDLRQRISTYAIRSTFDDDWAEIVSMIQAQQELEHKALAESQQLLVDEICLPDEDSLIAFDESLIPQQPESCLAVTQDESSLEYCFPDEESLITCDDLLAPQTLVSLSGEGSTKNEVMPPDATVQKPNQTQTESVVPKGQQSPSSVSSGVTSHQDCQQNSLHSGSAESNLRTPSSNASDSRQPQMHSQTKIASPNSHRPAPKRHFDAHNRHRGRRYNLPRIEPSVVPVLWPPLVFPHLHHEMLNGPAFSTYVAPPVPTHLPYSNSLPTNHLHHGYEVYRTHTPVQYYNNRSSGKRIS